METTTPECPSCGSDDVSYRVEEIDAVSYGFAFVLNQGHPEIIEGGELDRETLDTDRDGARIICRDCGEEAPADYAGDFLPDHANKEEEL